LGIFKVGSKMKQKKIKQWNTKYNIPYSLGIFKVESKMKQKKYKTMKHEI